MIKSLKFLNRKLIRINIWLQDYNVLIQLKASSYQKVNYHFVKFKHQKHWDAAFVCQFLQTLLAWLVVIHFVLTALFNNYYKVKIPSRFRKFKSWILLISGVQYVKHLKNASKTSHCLTRVMVISKRTQLRWLD